MRGFGDNIARHEPDAGWTAGFYAMVFVEGDLMKMAMPGSMSVKGRFAALMVAIVMVGCGAQGTDEPFDWCGGTAPDAACYSATRAPESENIELARAILDRYIDVYPGNYLGWTWEPTVLMTGVYELYRVTGEQRYLEYMKTWMDSRLELGYYMFCSDFMSPALIAAFLYMETGDEKYRAVVDDAFTYISETVIRTEDGGINHWGATEFNGGATLWLDTLFMVGTMLTRWGEFIDDGEPLDEMALQIKVFSDRLQSSDGLYVHAFNYNRPVDDDIYWGRGNGWVSAAGFDYLRARKIRGETDQFALDALVAQAEAAVAAQDADSGLWWIVLNRPGEAYLETSTTALFAYGMARGWRYGFLGDEYLPVIADAMRGIKATLTTDGQGRPVVSNVSGPTEAGTFEYYAGLELEDDLGYGVGSVLLALVETSGLPDMDP